MGVFDEAYFGTKSVQRLDAEFKQTTNYILLKYIYVLRSQMQLRELEDEIKISRDDRIQEKLTVAAEVLKKEEMAILKHLQEHDVKTIEIMEEMQDYQGYYHTKKGAVPIPEFFFTADLYETKFTGIYENYKNALYNSFLMELVEYKTIAESFNI